MASRLENLKRPPRLTVSVNTVVPISYHKWDQAVYMHIISTGVGVPIPTVNFCGVGLRNCNLDSSDLSCFLVSLHSSQIETLRTSGAAEDISGLRGTLQPIGALGPRTMADPGSTVSEN
jgi:hypothetical protein